MTRQIRFLDIPDGDPLPLNWLKELDSDYFEAHVAMVEKLGPIFAGCKVLAGNMQMLQEPVGRGQLAHLIMLPVRNGDLLAIHGFSTKGREPIDDEIALAARRRRELTGEV